MKFRYCLALILVLSTLSVTPLTAQENPEVRGQVTAMDGEPLRGARVVLQSAADTASTTSRADGVFRVSLPPGQYELRVTQLGYETFTRELTLDADASVENLGVIRLASAAIALEGVTVEGQQSPVVTTADRTIYHARDMPALQGGAASDALRGVPELEVDLEGRVSLQGESPQIHINGRPTPMEGEALQRFLQQLPAERIDRIEVIPNPSARYEAAGSGGIVNIVLRTDAGPGVSGSLGLTAGTRGQRGGFGSLAFQAGRLTLFGNGSLNFHDRSGTSYDFRENLLATPTTYLLQEGGWGNEGQFGRIDLSAEFQIGSQSHLWSSVAGGTFGFDMEMDTRLSLLDAEQAPTELHDRLATSAWDRHNLDASVGFRHVIAEGHELALEATSSQNRGGRDGRFSASRLDPSGSAMEIPSDLTLEETDEDERRLRLKVDYERPIAGFRMEMGYQANLQTTEHDQWRDVYAEEGDASPAFQTGSQFRYDETYHQGYVTANRRLGSLSVQAGLRAEHAETEFRLPTADEVFESTYSDLFPSANLSYELREGRTIGLSYSRRLQRPSVWFLNPVEWSIDPMTRQVGNPHLEPQYTHSVGGRIALNGPMGMLRVEPYFRSTENVWEQIIYADTLGALTSTWENIASTRRYGANASAMLPPAGPVSGNVAIGGHRVVRDAGNLSTAFSGEFFHYNANANLMFSLPGSVMLQTMLSFNSPQELPQGTRSAFVMSSVGVRKQFFDNRATLNFRIQDPFDIARFDIETRDESHAQVARNDWSARSLSLSLSYNFGQRPRSIRRPDREDPETPQPPTPSIGIPPN